MIEHVDVVGYGRPASEALARAIEQAKSGRGVLAPVTVVVPSNFAGLTARRLLGSGTVGTGGIANVSFVTPLRLAELLAADLLLDRRPLTNPILAAGVRLALAEDPGPFARVADHHATVAALAAMYAELSNVSEPRLRRIETEGGANARTAVRFRRAIGQHLRGFHEEADVARAAGSRPDLTASLATLGPIVWYLPEPIAAPMVDLLRAVGAAAPFIAVVGLTGDAKADEAVRQLCARVGVALDDPPPTAPPVGDVIVSVTDADEEVRAVVRRIGALVERGVRLDRIAVFYPSPDPYVATLEQQLFAAGIPANGPTRRKLADSVAGRTLLDALALPAQRWRRDRVMALVSSAPVREGDGLARPTTWERISREAGIVLGLDDWTRKIAIAKRAAQSELDRQLAWAEQSGVELSPEDWRVRRAAERQADLDGLLTFVIEIAAAVRTIEQAPSWTAKSEAATALLRRLLGGDNLHTRWPTDEQDAFDRVEDALSRLAALDEIEPQPTHDVFIGALSAELDVTRGRNGRYGNGVLYGPLASSVGQDLDAVFVLGCAEGLLPSARREDAMLPDSTRALADGELDLRTGRLETQHRAFLAALAAAPAGARTLTYARGDLRSSRRTLPSRWLLDTAGALHGSTVYATDFSELREPAVEFVSSQAGALRTTRTFASVDDRDLATLLRHHESTGDVFAHPVAWLVERGLEAQAARHASEFTEWDGNLAGQSIPSTSERAMSPTRLETWASCGYRYFLGTLLGLSERDEPERVLELNALDRGSAVHLILERFLAEMIDVGAPPPGVPWADEQRARLVEIAEDVFAEFEARGRTGRPVLWRLTKADVLAMLDEFLHQDDEYRARTGARPVSVELPFGFGGADPVSLTLADGRTLHFRGFADRVDRRVDGRLVVIDYKTGRASAYDEVRAGGDPVQGGSTLQLGLYAEAAIQQLGAEAAAAFYWIVNTRDAYEQIGYDWTDVEKERWLDVATAIVDGIDRGVFPLVPGEWDPWRGTYDNCGYCDFRELCPSDRGEQADAKATAVELRIRDRLVWEPTS